VSGQYSSDPAIRKADAVLRSMYRLECPGISFSQWAIGEGYASPGNKRGSICFTHDQIQALIRRGVPGS